MCIEKSVVFTSSVFFSLLVVQVISIVVEFAAVVPMCMHAGTSGK